MTSYPAEVYNLETGQVFEVIDMKEYPDGFDLIIRKNGRRVVAWADEWEILSVDSKAYVYSMIRKELKPIILRRTGI